VDHGQVDLIGEGEDVPEGRVFAGVDDAPRICHFFDRPIKMLVVAEIGSYISGDNSVGPRHGRDPVDAVYPSLQIEHFVDGRGRGRPEAFDQDLPPERAFMKWFYTVAATVLHNSPLPQVAELSGGDEPFDLGQQAGEQCAPTSGVARDEKHLRAGPIHEKCFPVSPRPGRVARTS
jgi:hypothetical protein